METVAAGDVLKNISTGEIYRIKLIGERMVLLEAEDRLSRILTTVGTLRLNYEKCEVARHAREETYRFVWPSSSFSV